MEVKIEQETSWKRALNAARRTVGKKSLDKEPSDEWKDNILYAEHSPIRLVEYRISFEGIKQWISVHLVRHFIGVIPFVHSQREDRRELPCKRDDLPQGAENDMDYICNAQALINISRKRLCNCASKETREAWQQVKKEMETVDAIMAKHMVRECCYRGFCPELKSCGYCKTKAFEEERAKYMEHICDKKEEEKKAIFYYQISYDEDGTKSYSAVVYDDLSRIGIPCNGWKLFNCSSDELKEKLKEEKWKDISEWQKETGKNQYSKDDIEIIFVNYQTWT